jgi:hypothetical protein
VQQRFDRPLESAKTLVIHGYIDGEMMDRIRIVSRALSISKQRPVHTTKVETLTFDPFLTDDRT